MLPITFEEKKEFFYSKLPQENSTEHRRSYDMPPPSKKPNVGHSDTLGRSRVDEKQYDNFVKAFRETCKSVIAENN